MQLVCPPQKDWYRPLLQPPHPLETFQQYRETVAHEGSGVNVRVADEVAVRVSVAVDDAEYVALDV